MVRNGGPLRTGSASAASPVILRLCLLAALFAVELTLLTVWFDFGKLGASDGRFSRWLVRVPMVMRLGSIAAAAMLAFAVARLWPDLRQDYGRLCRVDRWMPLVAGHLATMASFAYGTQVILDGGLDDTDHALFWIGVWLAAGGVSLVLWCLAAFPPALWRRLIELGWPMLAIGGIVAIAVWRSKVYLKDFWRPLADGTFWLSEKFLGLMYSETVSDPQGFVLGTSSFTVNIARACSGYEGVGLISAFLVGYLWLFRKRLRFPHALLLVPIGALAIWVANAGRIAVLVAIGTSWSRELALGGFHSQAGWIAFNFVALGIVAITGRSRFIAGSHRPTTSSRASNPTVAYLSPFLAIVGTTMITGALQPDFDWLYPLRVLAAGTLLWTFRKVYYDLRWTISFEAIAVGVITCVLWICLVPAGDDVPRGMPEVLSTVSPLWSGLWLVSRVLGYVVTAPLAEELAFRSYLTRRLTVADFSRARVGRFTWVSFLGSSLAFGAMHGSLWLPATLAGMLFAGILYRRRETADAVVAHSTTNLLLVLYSFTTGDWSAWS